MNSMTAHPPKANKDPGSAPLQSSITVNRVAHSSPGHPISYTCVMSKVSLIDRQLVGANGG